MQFRAEFDPASEREIIRETSYSFTVAFTGCLKQEFEASSYSIKQ